MSKTEKERESKALELTKKVYRAMVDDLYPQGVDKPGWGEIEDQFAVTQLVGAAVQEAGEIMLRVYQKKGLFKLGG